MSENAKSGAAAALSAAGGPGAAGAGQAGVQQQLGLLDGRPEPPAAPRGPGRPAGAKNKRTQAWQKWFEATGEMPLEFLAKTFRKSTGELAAELACDQDAALRIQVEAAKAVLPYVEQKLPLAIEDDRDQARMVIVVGDMTPEQRGEADQALGWKLLDNQPVSDAVIVQSDEEQSDG